jgi:hypothetical protein
MSEETKQPEEEKSGSDRASKMMDGMLKGLREFGHVAKEKAEEFGKMASDKAEELTKQGKIKLDIHQLGRSRNKAMIELGELVYNLNAGGELAKLAKHENFAELIESIVALDAEIAKKEAQAEAVESEDESEEKSVE